MKKKTEYNFSTSIACIMATATKPIAELHGVPAEVVMSWIAMVSAEEIREELEYPTRDGIVIFHLAGNPERRVVITVQVVKIPLPVEFEYWSGEKVLCTCNNFDWLWAYTIDWKTGNREPNDVVWGKYPHMDMSLKPQL